MVPFELVKWYLDCITPDGDVSVVYAGELRCGMVRLSYSSVLESCGDRIKIRHSLRPNAAPVQAGEHLSWNHDGLKLKGDWHASAAPWRETIYSTEQGSIEWSCLQPKSEVCLNDRRGLGYAERIRMNLAPWRLPLKTLRWGHFASPEASVVWIDWIGPESHRLILRNGTLHSTTQVTDDHVSWDDGTRLDLDRSLVLRDGALSNIAASAIPCIRDAFPARFLQTHETKWRSQAILHSPASASVTGWALHEKVDWTQ